MLGFSRSKCMKNIQIIKHRRGALGLRLFGLGPKMKPMKGLIQLKKLLDEHTFWAKGRSMKRLKMMLSKSTVVITVWRENNLIGFGRANSDYIFRSVLWDIVVANENQGEGIGSLLIETLINAPEIKDVEKIYLMTTHCSNFYKNKGFQFNSNQKLLYINRISEISKNN